MTCAEVKSLLMQHVASPGTPVLADEAVGHIGSCPHCLEDLAVVATLVTGRPSALLHEVFERHACDLIDQLLPDWVQADLDGKGAAQRNPAAWQHAQRCDRCLRALAELREMLVEAEAGAFGPAPWQYRENVAAPHVKSISNLLSAGEVPAAALQSLPRVQSSIRAGQANAIAPERLEELARVAENVPLKSKPPNELLGIDAPAGREESVEENARPATIPVVQTSTRGQGREED
jgi:hypothetical protein